jgi:uncharacterized protein (DUF362 family)
MNRKISRRAFLKISAGAAGGCLFAGEGGFAMAREKSSVLLVKTGDRKEGVRKIFDRLGAGIVKGKAVLIKPNFNTADIAPGSTHNETLAALIDEIWKGGAKSVSLGERSYPPTRQVMEEKGVLELAGKREVKIIDFDQLAEKDWVEFKPAGSHWPGGFRVARPILEAECLISTGCLKTHQYGGVFTLSLKLHVGVVPTSRNGYDYMRQLHGSPHQRRMIAEINEPFRPALVVMDGVDAFVDGGPAVGKRVRGDVFWASADRVAADAVGVALLKHLGGNEKIMGSPIFAQEQIARAADLGLGASSPAAIELAAADENSREYAERVSGILREG